MALTARPRTNATILLLSSAPLVRAAMREILENAGYVVEPAGDLGTAVDRLANPAINLLITHPYVEEIPGYEAAKYLRGRNPRMGVLVVAGLPDDTRLRIPAELEAFEIFPRPFTAAELIEKVEMTLQATAARLSSTSTPYK
jgi:DNA-binding NtrC family response regulator